MSIITVPGWRNQPDERAHGNPVLFGGIGQQPSPLRLPTQVDDASNVDFSIYSGVSKRCATRYTRVVSGLTAAGDYRLHPIYRDESEQYEVVYGCVSGFVAIKPLENGGPASTVTISDDAMGYLLGGKRVTLSVTGAVIASIGGGQYTLTSAGAFAAYTDVTGDSVYISGGTGVTTAGYARVDSGTNDVLTVTPLTCVFGAGNANIANVFGPYPDTSEIKLVTITDATFIVNTNVTTALLTSPSYTLTRTYKNADIMVSNTPAVDSYHRALADGVDLDAGYYKYTPGGTGATPFPTIDITPAGWSDWVDVNGSDWSSSGRKGFRIGFQRKPLTVNNAVIASVGGSTTRFTLTLAGAFTNYTFEQGDQFRVNGESAGAATYPGTETAGWVTVVSRDSDDQCTVDAATPTGPTYGAGRSAVLVDIGGGSVDTIDITTVGREYEILIDFSVDYAAGDITDLDDIAARIQREFRNQSEDGVTVAWVPIGNVGKFRVGGPWRGSDATIIATQPPTSGSSMTDAGEPFSNTAADYTITAGTSTSAESVRVDVADRWTRVSAPSQTEWAPDPVRMPLKMTRTAYTGDGATPATFSVATVDWDERPDGDELTNPAPDLLVEQKAISDIGYRDGRLILAGGERIHYGQAQNLYAFFKENADTTVDSDPVTVSLTGTQVTNIAYIVPHLNDDFVFTKAGNAFQVYSDGPFTPSSARVKPLRSYNHRDIRPQVMDGRVLFVARDSGGDRTKGLMMEYVYDDSLASTTANQLNAHAPTIFDSLPQQMVVVPELSTTVLLTTDTNRLYLHKSFFLNGNREQSAWTKYDFDASIRVSGMCNIPAGLRLLTEGPSAGTYLIETIRFEGEADSEADGTSWVFRGDRLIELTGVHAAGTTTWTLPFSDTTINRLYYNNTEVTVSSSGTSVTASGDYSGASGFLGRLFAASFTLPRQYYRSQNGTADPELMPVIQRMTVNCRRSGSFVVTITRTSGMSSVTRTFTPKNGKIEGAASFRVNGVGPSNQVSIAISSSNTMPLNIPTIAFNTTAARLTENS